MTRTILKDNSTPKHFRLKYLILFVIYMKEIDDVEKNEMDAATTTIHSEVLEDLVMDEGQFSSSSFFPFLFFVHPSLFALVSLVESIDN